MPLHGKPEKGEEKEPAKPFDAEADDEQPPDDDSESGIGGDDTEVLTDPAGIAAAPPPAEPAETTSNRREYVVLKAVSDGPKKVGGVDDTFKIVWRGFATGAEQAIRSLGETGLEHGASYVAVPARSWNPQPVGVDTKTTITIGA